MRRPLPLAPPPDDFDDLAAMSAEERQATTPIRRVSGDDAPTTMFEQAAPRIGRLSLQLEAVLVTTALLLVFAVAMFTMVLLAG